MRGLDRTGALIKAMLNGAFSSLESGYRTTGDTERSTAALQDLCAWIGSCVASAR